MGFDSVNLILSSEQSCRDIASGIVGALYADGWRESFEGIQRLVNALRRQ